MEKTTCHICGKMLSKGSLDAHIKRLHTGVPPYKCEKCKKSWYSKFLFEKHNLARHSAYSCQYCPKRFAVYRSFKCHVARHSNVKKYTCELCSKQFAQSNTLTSHIRWVHTKKVTSKFVCDQCGASFKTSTHLKRHSAIHFPDKHFVCQFCGKRCTQSTNLKVHIMGVHKDKSHLVYPDNVSLPKVDPSSLIMPSYEEYLSNVKKDINIGTNKTPVGPRNQSKKADKQTKSKINRKDINSKCTSETTDETYVIISCDPNSQRDLNIDNKITLGKIEFVKVPFEWNEERQCKVILYDCKLEIPLKVEAVEPSDHTNNLDIPVEDYEPWDDADDTELYESEIMTSKDTEAPDRTPLSYVENSPVIEPQKSSNSCKFCKETFLLKSCLDEHIAAFHNDKMNTCQPSPKKSKISKTLKARGQFIQKKRLVKKRSQSSKAGHSQTRRFKCIYCPGSSFKRFDAWKMHALFVHMKERNYMCHICSKIFQTIHKLKRHIDYVHLNIRKHSCDTCGASFPTLHKLKRHIGIHSDVKPYKCQFCGKECTQAGNLKIHIMGVHRDISHQVYKKTEPLKPVDPSTIIIPASSKEYFKMFPAVANALVSNGTVPEQSQS